MKELKQTFQKLNELPDVHLEEIVPTKYLVRIYIDDNKRCEFYINLKGEYEVALCDGYGYDLLNQVSKESLKLLGHNLTEYWETFADSGYINDTWETDKGVKVDIKLYSEHDSHFKNL